MIGKIVKGRGFRGVLEYALQKEKGKLIGTNMASDNPRGLAKEFGAIRELKPRLKNAVFHSALSAPKNENISEEKWVQIIDEYRNKMGFGDSQYVAVRHADTEHDHVHFIANRIDMGGRVVSDKLDFAKQEKALRAIEKQFQLLPLAAPRKARQRPSTQSEVAKVERTGELSSKMLIHGFCAAALELASTLDEYVSKLKQWNVKTTLFTRDEKRILKGITYEWDGFKISASKLGTAFMAEGLSKRGLVYSAEAPEALVLPQELEQYMRDAIGNYTRLNDADEAEQELLWRAWLKRDPHAAVAWCTDWVDGEDAGHIPTEPEPGLRQAQQKRPDDDYGLGM